MLCPAFSCEPEAARNLVFFDIDDAPTVMKALSDKGIRSLSQHGGHVAQI